MSGERWSRRRFLLTAAAVVASGPAAGQTIAGAVVRPEQFGAVGDGRADDTRAVQAAIDDGRPVDFGDATRRYLLVCAEAPAFDYGNTNVPAFAAIRLRRGGVALTGSGAAFAIAGRRAAEGLEVNYMFATGKHQRPDHLGGLTVSGLRFDFDPRGQPGRNLRSFHLAGFGGVRFRDCRFLSSGPRAGATITLQNLSGVAIEDCSFRNTTQAMNLSYVEDVRILGSSFDNFSEAIDFDRVVRRAILRDLDFRNGGQCIDLSSVEDVTIERIRAARVRNFTKLNYKPTTPETYADYVASTEPRAQTVSRRVTIVGVRGEHVGDQRNPAIDIGIRRGPAAYDGFGPVEDVTIRDLAFRGCGATFVTEARRLVLEDVTLADVVTPTTVFPAAITAMSDVRTARGIADSDLDIVLRRVTVRGSTGEGVRIVAPGRLLVEGLVVEGTTARGGDGDGAGLRVIRPEARNARIALRALDLRGDRSGAPALIVEAQRDDFSLDWDADNRLSAAAPVRASVAAARRFAATERDIADTFPDGVSLPAAPRRLALLDARFVRAGAAALPRDLRWRLGARGPEGFRLFAEDMLPAALPAGIRERPLLAADLPRPVLREDETLSFEWLDPAGAVPPGLWKLRIAAPPFRAA